MRFIGIRLINGIPVPQSRHGLDRVAFVWLTGITLLLGVGACSDEQRTIEDDSTQLVLDDALVPEVMLEGESVTVSAWGRTGAGSFDRLEVEVVTWPSSDPGRIEVRAIGSRTSNLDQTSFEGQIQLPLLRPGDYQVHLQGSGEIRTLSVFPREGWVRYRSYDDPVRADLALHIKADGTALVHRANAGSTVRARLGENERAAIRQWFAEAEFFSLDEKYTSEHPSRVRQVDIALHTDRGHHQVTAQEDRMPAELAELVARLDRLVDSLLAAEEETDPVIAQIQVDPLDAEPGTGRRLTLTLVNLSDEAVTLRFPTAQVYDFTLLRPDRNDLPGGDGDPNTPSDVLVWNWAHGRVFAPEEYSFTMEPGETRVMEERWSGVDNDGGPVGSGIYHLKATVLSQPRVRPVATRIVVSGRVPDRISLVGTIAVDPTTAPPGTQRKLMLAVTNLNEFDLVSTFPSAQRFDFVLIRRTGPDDQNNPPDNNTDIRGLVWKWSEGQSFPQAEEMLTWPAGTTRVFDAEWDGLDRTNQVVGPGIYELRGWITARPGASIRPVSVVVSRQ